ncbi:MAG TPA: ADOP family duplicated permease [Thermoanaerobaculia bacterium]|nr:ADOP family duplicated permease [Thermoanaerobaculia bacterium]
MRDDVRYTLRRWKKTPGATLFVVLLMGGAVAAVTTIYSVVWALELRELPFPEGHELVRLSQTDPRGRGPFQVSLANFEDWKSSATSFESLLAYRSRSETIAGSTPAGEGPTARLRVGAASAELFSQLGVDAQLGRVSGVGDAAADAPAVLVLSEALWRSRFGGDADVVGRAVQLGETAYEVIGVLPSDFHFPPTPLSYVPEAWTVLRPSPDELAERGRGTVSVFGRLRDDATLASAQREMDAIAEQIGVSHPATNEGWGVRVDPAKEFWSFALEQLGRPVLLAGALVLLLACANVGGLSLSELARRRREMIVRAALGARQSRLMRQLLVESTMIAGAAGLVGVTLTVVLIRVAANLLPESVPLVGEIALDPEVLGFCLAVTTLCAFLSGLLPALRSRSFALFASLRNSSSTRSRARQALLVAQLAVALATVIATALLVASLRNTLEEPRGYVTEGVAVARLALPRELSPAARFGLTRQLEERLASDPAVYSSAVADFPPLFGNSEIRRFEVRGSSPASQEQAAPRSVDVRRVGESYFEALEVPLVHGRMPRIAPPGAPIQEVLVNRAFARSYLDAAGGDETLDSARSVNGVVGRIVELHEDISSSASTGPPEVATVVGMVGDEKFWRLDGEASAQVYVLGAGAGASVSVLARGRTPGDDLHAAIRRAAGDVDERLAVYGATTLEAQAQETSATRRFTVAVTSLFGIVALLLAAAGVYAQATWSVEQRRPELGVRIALGADRGDVFRTVFGSGLIWIAGGAVGGVVLALAFSRLLASSLYGVKAHDPAILALATAVLAGAAVVALLPPGVRATRVDPLVTLKDADG